MKLKLLPIFILFFGFTTIPKQYRGMTKNEIVLRHMNTSTNEKKTLKTNSRRPKNSKISFNPVFDSEIQNIKRLSRFYARLDGNIIVSSDPVVFKVNLLKNPLFPENSYLSCIGEKLISKYNYRLKAHCDYLVTDKIDYPVNVTLKDLKKVEGLVPDHIYTGEEEEILGSAFSAFTSSLIDSSKDRVQTSLGFVEKPNLKNAYLNGLTSAASESNSKSLQHSKDNNIVMAIKDKTKVIVEFKEALKWEVQ